MNFFTITIMTYGQVLRSPAAAEVRSMLHKIKLDNMERARHIAASRNNLPPMQAHQPERGAVAIKKMGIKPMQNIMARWTGSLRPAPAVKPDYEE